MSRLGANTVYGLELADEVVFQKARGLFEEFSNERVKVGEKVLTKGPRKGQTEAEYRTKFEIWREHADKRKYPQVVFAPPPLHYGAPTPQASPTYQRQFQAALKQRLEALVAEQRKLVGDVKVACELFEHTSHGQGLIDYAADKKIDVVVLGTLGRSNLKTLLLGSTAERVVRETPCSVLAVPPKAE